MRLFFLLLIVLPSCVLAQFSDLSNEERFARIFLDFSDLKPSADIAGQTAFQQMAPTQSKLKTLAADPDKLKEGDKEILLSADHNYSKQCDHILDKLCKKYDLSRPSYEAIQSEMSTNLEYQIHIGNIIRVQAEKTRPR